MFWDVLGCSQSLCQFPTFSKEVDVARRAKRLTCFTTKACDRAASYADGRIRNAAFGESRIKFLAGKCGSTRRLIVGRNEARVGLGGLEGRKCRFCSRAGGRLTGSRGGYRIEPSVAEIS